MVKRGSAFQLQGTKSVWEAGSRPSSAPSPPRWLPGTDQIPLCDDNPESSPTPGRDHRIHVESMKGARGRHGSQHCASVAAASKGAIHVDAAFGTEYSNSSRQQSAPSLDLVLRAS